MIPRMRRIGRVPGLAVQRAQAVHAALPIKHPTELEISVIAHARGALVRAAPTRGARANILRVGDRAVISVADGLSVEQQRWAIAHELGHFEAHPHVNYLGFCTGEDLRADYHGSGREPEANAFAAELLMPAEMFQKRVDSFAKPSWSAVQKLAAEFQVSLTAAAFRFVELSGDRIALYLSKGGKVIRHAGRRDFGRRRRNDEPLNEYSLAYDFFKKGRIWRGAQTVSAEAWAPGARDTEEVYEDVFVLEKYSTVMSLVWFPPR